MALIVENSARIRDSLTRGLICAGFTVDQAVDGVEACYRLDSFRYENVLPDLSLPRENVLAGLDHLRNRNNRPKISILSAHEQMSEKLTPYTKAQTEGRGDRDSFRLTAGPLSGH